MTSPADIPWWARLSGAPKLRVPVPPVSVVRRAAVTPLVSLASANLRDKGTVVVVTGSVGAGKTLLLSMWAHDVADQGHHVAWATLGQEDNDPHILWQTLLATITGALDEPSAAMGAVAQVRSDIPPAGLDVDLVTDLVIGLQKLDHPLWLMLDDVQALSEPRALAALDLLLRWAPQHLNVVLASRADPALHLQRLRLDGRVRDVRDAQLRLSAEETREALVAQELVLTDEQVQALHRMTEGWAAGVGLAGISLRAGRDVDDLLHSLALGDRAVAAYLMEEVLSGLPDDDMSFLQVTCLPELLSVRLAQHLSGREDAGDILHRLAQANSLVSLVRGPEGPSFRYHALLRAYLSARLESRGSQRAAAMHREVSTWFADAGSGPEALRHATVSGDPALADTMVRRYGLQLLLSGRVAAVREALASIPVVLRQDPVAAAMGVLAALEVGDLGAARSAALALESLAGAGESDQVRGPSTSNAFESRVVALARCRLARRSLVPAPARGADPAPTSIIRGAGVPGLRDLELLEQVEAGEAALRQGELDQGAQLLGDALTTARRAGYTYTVVSCLSLLAGAAAAAGDLAGIRRWSGTAIRSAATEGWASSPSLLPAYAAAAAGAFEEADLKQARRSAHLAQVIIGAPSWSRDTAPAASRPEVDPDVERAVWTIVTAVDFLDSAPDTGRQREIVRARLAVLERLPTERVVPGVAAYELTDLHRMAMMTGQLDAARRVIALAERSPALRGDALVLRADTLMRSHHESEAREALTPVLRGAVTPVLLRERISALLLQTRLAQRNGQPAVAHDALLAAVDLAAPNGMVRHLAEYDPRIVTMLAERRGRFGRHEAFVGQVLDLARRQCLGEPRTTEDELPAASPVLTPREESLLRDLPSLLTVSEIATERGVSANTVKTQLRSLYEKLGVASRRQAVAAGRQHGLL